MIRILALLVAMSTITVAGCAQFSNFDITFEPVHIEEWTGVQSFAMGHQGQEVVIIGGRRDGLHRRQPWASFDIPGHNTSIVVLNLETLESWSWDITGLPMDVEDQLSSTNINFYQDDGTLVLAGGYGYSRLRSDHTTFEGLIAINLENLIDAIKANDVSPDLFKYTSDPRFAVTGGGLLKLYNKYYLAAGQRFEGRYNPMNHPTFTQEYTEQVRRFRMDPSTLQVEWLDPFEDTDLLHRRDLNVQPVITEDGQEAFVLYSGVFQKAADLPFLNAVLVDTSGVTEVSGLMQIFNQYHCATIPVFDIDHSEMTTIFFGGMAQYYMDTGQLVKDDNVPFVNTIARVVRNADGEYYEERMAAEMPGLLGSSAEFFINPDLPVFSNEVIDWASVDSDTALLGYIVGGIASTERNIFFINDGTQSETYPTILKVFAYKRVNTSVSDIDNEIFIHAFPNPSDGRITVNLSIKKKGRVNIDLFDQEGQLIRQLFEEELSAGWHSFDLVLPDQAISGSYLLMVRNNDAVGRRTVIIK